MSDRPKFVTRIIRLVSEKVRDLLLAVVRNLPIDAETPIEVRIGEERKARKLDQNAAMWAGPLRDIEQQAWIEGRQFSIDVWHVWLKKEYLPEDDDPDLDELVRDGYRKWDIDPAGERVLVGSTTQLTVKGFARYLNQVEAFGAGLGVQFSARERVAA